MPGRCSEVQGVPVFYAWTCAEPDMEAAELASAKSSQGSSPRCKRWNHKQNLHAVCHPMVRAYSAKALKHNPMQIIAAVLTRLGLAGADCARGASRGRRGLGEDQSLVRCLSAAYVTKLEGSPLRTNVSALLLYVNRWRASLGSSRQADARLTAGST